MDVILSKAEITAAHVATALTKETLASRLRTMVEDPRRFNKIERTAFLLEAARRLEQEVPNAPSEAPSVPVAPRAGQGEVTT